MRITPPAGGGVIGPASPVAWGAHRWARPNRLSQSQAQPLSLWSPPAGVLCLCHSQWVLCLCRPAPGAAGAAEAGAVAYRRRMLVPPLQRSSPTVLSPPDKCPSRSEPRPSRQQRLKFVSSEPPLGVSWTFTTILTRALVQKSHDAQQFAQTAVQRHCAAKARERLCGRWWLQRRVCSSSLAHQEAKADLLALIKRCGGLEMRVDVPLIAFA